MYIHTNKRLEQNPWQQTSYPSSNFGYTVDPAYTPGLGNSSLKHRILIFIGYSGSGGTQEKDSTHFLTALTLKEHISRRFPSDVIEIICAWHKNVFVNALMTPSAKDPTIKIRQIHYIGHGNQGGLFFGYHNNTAKAEREKLFNWLTTGFWISNLSLTAKRRFALYGEAGLLSGFFTDGLSISKLSQIKAQLTPDALMHIWGCFTGDPRGHTFENKPYWDLFNAASAPVDGIAKHIAKSLEIQVTAVWEASGIHGTDFCIRDDKTNAITCPDKRKPFIPTWSWPLSKKVRWITYDSAGNGDETSINFLGTRRSSKDLAPGKPPKWFTDEIPKVTKKIPTFPSTCSAVFVPI